MYLFAIKNRISGPIVLSRCLFHKIRVGYLRHVFLRLLLCSLRTIMEDERSFPKGFLFGAATAAFQVEGAWNKDGRGESFWDRITHTNPDLVADRSNADVSCDSYHNYKKDVLALKQLGVDFYRFSISWTRILPSGVIDTINQAGIDYYNNLITDLINHNIQPVVTMHHWDLPQSLMEMGGWMNPIVADFFEDYARILFKNFGDRVKWWITLNEPGHICKSYVKKFMVAPGYQLQKQGGNFLALNILLKAHAKVYHMYNEEFRHTQQGKIGMALNTRWFEPLSDSEDDNLASWVALQFDLGTFAHPIFSDHGDYPSIVRRKVDQASIAEGLNRSRLPHLDEFWLQHIKNSADFFGLNHYTSRTVTFGDKHDSLYEDSGVSSGVDAAWPGSSSDWLYVVPWGLRKLLNWIKKEYNNPPVIITENGFSDSSAENIHDSGRIDYHAKYMDQLLKAIHVDGCKVIGYTVWSLLDNYEWLNGYSKKFGVFHVDFNDPSRPRTPKDSVKFLKEVFRTKKLPKLDTIK